MACTGSKQFVLVLSADFSQTVWQFRHLRLTQRRNSLREMILCFCGTFMAFFISFEKLPTVISTRLFEVFGRNSFKANRCRVCFWWTKIVGPQLDVHISELKIYITVPINPSRILHILLYIYIFYTIKCDQKIFAQYLAKNLIVPYSCKAFKRICGRAFYKARGF